LSPPRSALPRRMTRKKKSTTPMGSAAWTSMSFGAASLPNPEAMPRAAKFEPYQASHMPLRCDERAAGIPVSSCTAIAPMHYIADSTRHSMHRIGTNSADVSAQCPGRCTRLGNKQKRKML
jgi:hypothetical protein